MLAWNPLAATLVADFSRRPPDERNLTWQVFCGTTGASADYSPSDWSPSPETVSPTCAPQPPATPTTRASENVIARLRTGSELFATWWDEHQVATRRGGSKTMRHPTVGEIDLDLTDLVVPDHDQRVIIYSAQPSTPSADAMRLLAVVGTRALA